MKNTKITLAIFFLLLMTGAVIAGTLQGRYGLYRFGYERSLNPEALNQNFEILSEIINRLEYQVREQKDQIRTLKSNETRLRYYVNYLYQKSSESKDAEDWRRSVHLETENAFQDLGLKTTRK